MEERTITFIVTKECQLRCKYCYLIGKNSHERMPVELAQKVIDYILSNPVRFPEKSVVFDFIGGEPLLEIHLIDQITSYAVSRVDALSHHWKDKYRIRITTNGLLYGKKDVQDYIEKYKEKLSISISFDGIKEKHDLNRIFQSGEGSYDRIIPNIHLWQKQFPREGTKMVVSHDDLKYVKNSAIHLIELGIKTIDINTVVEDVWQPDDEFLFEQQLIELADYILDNDLENQLNISVFNWTIGNPLDREQKLTPCGTMTLSVDARGDFYTCLRFADFSLHTKNARSIGSVYCGIDWNKLRPYSTIDNQSYSPPQCLTCEVASGCKSCPAENYDSSSTGTIFQRATAICKMHKAKVRAKNYYWNKLNRKQY